MRRRRRGPRRGATKPRVRGLIVGNSIAFVRRLTYHRDNLLLDLRGKRDELKEQSKVELFAGQSIVLGARGAVGAYGGDEEGKRNGLLSAGHDCGLYKERGVDVRGGGSIARAMISILRRRVYVVRGREGVEILDD